MSDSPAEKKDSRGGDAAQAGQLRPTGGRKFKNDAFVGICIFTASLSMVILGVLLVALCVQGRFYLTWNFLSAPPSPEPTEAGIMPAMWGTVWVCVGCALFALPLGVATAIFLEEFPPRHKVTKALHSFIQLNIANLAGVPSVVYGIIGLTAFAAMFGLFDRADRSHNARWEIGIQYYDQFLTEGDRVVLIPVSGSDAAATEISSDTAAITTKGKRVDLNVIGDRDPLPDDEKLLAFTIRETAEGGRIDRRSWYYLSLPLGRGVITGSLTLMLVVLPVVIIATQESLRAVPSSLREGALGMGATRWQTVWNVTLPAAVPGIMTGSILAMSRAIGEAAPILMISGIVFIISPPGHLMDDFTVMPLQIYDWAKRPQEEFHHLAASGIVILLMVLLAFNAVAVFIRQKYQKPLS